MLVVLVPKGQECHHGNLAVVRHPGQVPELDLAEVHDAGVDGDVACEHVFQARRSP